MGWVVVSLLDFKRQYPGTKKSNRRKNGALAEAPHDLQPIDALDATASVELAALSSINRTEDTTYWTHEKATISFVA